ncbi:hypothetical protein SAMN05444158_7131 [Bradyrhizobium canariense]|uniref:Uncharacterized protein n=1 Tax=Bradyrhizobium canariense TaxID=255045 RepID=A0A1H2BGP5_9BRAD|nr:hypothetical protein SAMN05444158_7131 [Bradyrhizobium canariense]
MSGESGSSTFEPLPVRISPPDTDRQICGSEANLNRTDEGEDAT